MMMKASEVKMTWMEASAGYRTASASIQVILITAEAFMFMGIMDKVVPLSKAESEGGGSIITLL